MADLTDPVRELIESLELLATFRGGGRGDQVMATGFAVEAWSSEFHTVLACLSERLELVVRLIADAELYGDYRDRLTDDACALRALFSPTTLFVPWDNHGAGAQLIRQHVPQLMAASMAVSRTHQIPRLSDADRQEMLDGIADFRSFLTAQQLSDRDFIRQSILDGLAQFEFRLERLQWFGWGYTHDALKVILAAYLALEREMPGVGERPDMDAVARKTLAFAKRIYRAAGAAKDAVELGGFITSAVTGGVVYGAAQAGLKLLTGP